jgi:molybdopterin-synthase adenylyltransferase
VESFDPGWSDRYSRQLIFPGLGEAGQRRLARSTVMVAGAGGLGCPVSIYLAAAGIGELRICDQDEIELSNLNRQILYGNTDIGRPKADVAAARLRGMNPEIRIKPQVLTLDAESLAAVADGVDLVIDCVDNFATRHLLNQYCVERRVPLLHAGVWGMGGQLALLTPPTTPCLRCVFPELPPAGEATPVLGVGAGLIGCAQASLALRLLAGLDVPERGKLLVLEGAPLSLRQIVLRRAAGCPACDREAPAQVGDPDLP